MSEYFTNVVEAREFVDKKINHLKQVLDRRRLVLNWELDKISSDPRKQSGFVSIRLDWLDKEIRLLMRDVGAIEAEFGTMNTTVHTFKKDSVFEFWGAEKNRNESDYMTMKRPKRSVSACDVGKVAMGQEIGPLDTSRESMGYDLEEITSPVTTSRENSFFPSDVPLAEDSYVPLAEDSYVPPAEDSYVPPAEDSYTAEKKGSIAKWKSVELLSDPIYEIIDEKSLRQIAGTLGKKKKIASKKVSAVFDLPVVARCPQGKRLGQLDRPKGVAVCPKGRIFVAEKGNNRVQVFDSSANFIRSFGERTGSNKMIGPYGLFVREDMVYVTLTTQHCMQMYTCQGVFVREKGRQGREEGRLKSPTGIDGDTSRGRVLVCDTGNNRIQLFDKDLKFIKVIRTTPLDRPLDVKVAKLGDFMVLDRSHTLIHLFNCFGELLREVIDIRSCVKLVNPLFFTLSPQGEVIVSDFSNHCVYVFGSDRNISWTLGEGGKGRPLEEPRGLACDERGRLITVSNKKKDCLQIFEL